MNRAYAVLVSTAVALCAPGAWAGVGQGDFEAGIQVSHFNMKTETDVGGTTMTTTTKVGIISGVGGYFITDMIQGKIAVSAVLGDGFTFGIINPGVDFVFAGRRKVAPFVGLSYGKSFGDDLVVDTDYFEGHAGAKFFVRERASLEAKLVRYEPTESAAPGRTELAVGINVYF